MLELSGAARVYLDPTPADGPHPGYRGEITADLIGVHLTPVAEFIMNDDRGWDELGIHATVPWARISSIEWASAPCRAPADGRHLAASRDQEWPSP